MCSGGSCTGISTEIEGEPPGLGAAGDVAPTAVGSEPTVPRWGATISGSSQTARLTARGCGGLWTWKLSCSDVLEAGIRHSTRRPRACPCPDVVRTPAQSSRRLPWASVTVTLARSAPARWRHSSGNSSARAEKETSSISCSGMVTVSPAATVSMRPSSPPASTAQSIPAEASSSRIRKADKGRRPRFRRCAVALRSHGLIGRRRSTAAERLAGSMLTAQQRRECPVRSRTARSLRPSSSTGRPPHRRAAARARS